MGDFQGHPFRGNQYAREVTASREAYVAAAKANDEKYTDAGLAAEIKARERYAKAVGSRPEEIEANRGTIIAASTGRTGLMGAVLNAADRERGSMAPGRDPEFDKKVVNSILLDGKRDLSKQPLSDAEWSEMQARSKGASAPDLGHLARENKIPANAAAVRHTPESHTLAGWSRKEVSAAADAAEAAGDHKRARQLRSAVADAEMLEQRQRARTEGALPLSEKAANRLAEMNRPVRDPVGDVSRTITGGGDRYSAVKTKAAVDAAEKKVRSLERSRTGSYDKAREVKIAKAQRALREAQETHRSALDRAAVGRNSPQERGTGLPREGAAERLLDARRSRASRRRG